MKTHLAQLASILAFCAANCAYASLPPNILLEPPYYNQDGHTPYGSVDAALDASVAQWFATYHIPADCPIVKRSFPPSISSTNDENGQPMYIVATASPGPGWTYQHCNTFSWGAGAYLRPSDNNTQSLGPPCGNGGFCVGNPINVFDHMKYQVEGDYQHGALQFSRYYSGSDAVPLAHMGARWRHFYDRSLVFLDFGGYSDSGAIVVTREDGKRFSFTKENGAWIHQRDLAAELIEIHDSVTNQRTGWIYRTNNSSEFYTLNGVLTSIQYNNGNVVTLSYSDGDTPPSQAPIGGLLTKVTDQLGRFIQLFYDNDARITKVTLPDATYFSYAYDANSNLTSVTRQDGTVKTYTYNEPAQIANGLSFPNALTGVIDENAVRYSTFSYGNNEAATETFLSGGINMYSISGANVTYPITSSGRLTGEFTYQ